MNARERMNELLERFGEMNDQKLSLDDAGACAYRFGEAADLGHFEFLEESGCVLLWATVGFLPPDRHSPFRVVRLLQLQDLGQGADGFTLGAEAKNGRVVIAARRAVDEIEDSAVLAGWADSLAEAVRAVREEMVDAFPVEQDDFSVITTDLDDEGEDGDEEGEA